MFDPRRVYGSILSIPPHLPRSLMDVGKKIDSGLLEPKNSL